MRSADLAEDVREHFPILEQEVNGKPLVYLDSAATSHKPLQVLDVIRQFNLRDTANVHRGVHALASRATDAYEAARGKLAAFINAPSDREIVWTKNATEAINLIAQSWAMHNLKDGDEVRESNHKHVLSITFGTELYVYMWKYGGRQRLFTLLPISLFFYRIVAAIEIVCFGCTKSTYGQNRCR